MLRRIIITPLPFFSKKDDEYAFSIFHFIVMEKVTNERENNILFIKKFIRRPSIPYSVGSSRNRRDVVKIKYKRIFSSSFVGSFTLQIK